MEDEEGRDTCISWSRRKFSICLSPAEYDLKTVISTQLKLFKLSPIYHLPLGGFLYDYKGIEITDRHKMSCEHRMVEIIGNFRMLDFSPGNRLTAIVEKIIDGHITCVYRGMWEVILYDDESGKWAGRELDIGQEVYVKVEAISQATTGLYCIEASIIRAGVAGLVVIQGHSQGQPTQPSVTNSEVGSPRHVLDGLVQETSSPSRVNMEVESVPETKLDDEQDSSLSKGEGSKRKRKQSEQSNADNKKHKTDGEMKSPQKKKSEAKEPKTPGRGRFELPPGFEHVMRGSRKKYYHPDKPGKYYSNINLCWDAYNQSPGASETAPKPEEKKPSTDKSKKQSESESDEEPAKPEVKKLMKTAAEVKKLMKTAAKEPAKESQEPEEKKPSTDKSKKQKITDKPAKNKSESESDEEPAKPEVEKPVKTTAKEPAKSQKDAESSDSGKDSGSESDEEATTPTVKAATTTGVPKTTPSGSDSSSESESEEDNVVTKKPAPSKSQKKAEVKPKPPPSKAAVKPAKESDSEDSSSEPEPETTFKKPAAVAAKKPAPPAESSSSSSESEEEPEPAKASQPVARQKKEVTDSDSSSSSDDEMDIFTQKKTPSQSNSTTIKSKPASSPTKKMKASSLKLLKTPEPDSSQSKVELAKFTPLQEGMKPPSGISKIKGPGDGAKNSPVESLKKDTVSSSPLSSTIRPDSSPRPSFGSKISPIVKEKKKKKKKESNGFL